MKSFASDLKTIYHAPDEKTAYENMQEVMMKVAVLSHENQTVARWGYRTKSVDKNRHIHSNFNVKIWYIFLRISFHGGLCYEAS